MKLKKSLIMLATMIGAGTLFSASVVANEYTQSFSGNVRVEATSSSSKVGDADSTTTLTTGFGGDEEESSTGGDTYLQWNHGFEGDNGAASGFIRFASDGLVRINVAGSSELDNYKGEIKAEWETDGFGGEVAERDQFAKLTHTGIGLYYKIGREEWFGNQKGYASDAGSYTKSYADAVSPDFASVGNIGARISGHALGWAGAGLDVSLFLQRDNGGSSSGQPIGLGGAGNEAADVVSSAGLKLGYANSIVDVAFATVSGSVAGQGTYDHDDDTATAEIDKGQTDSSAFSELQLALTFGSVKPFLNFGSLTTEDQNLAGDATKAISASGTNLGVSIGLGASDLVLAFGSSSWEDSEAAYRAAADAVVDADGVVTTPAVTEDTPTTKQTRSGFDLIWATNQDPLKVSLYFASQSGSDTVATSATATRDDSVSQSQYGVRLDFGF